MSSASLKSTLVSRTFSFGWWSRKLNIKTVAIAPYARRARRASCFLPLIVTLGDARSYCQCMIEVFLRALVASSNKSVQLSDKKRPRTRDKSYISTMILIMQFRTLACLPTIRTSSSLLVTIIMGYLFRTNSSDPFNRSVVQISLPLKEFIKSAPSKPLTC